MEGAISNTLFQQNAVMLATDEAHCIHEWLHQFFITLVVLVTCVTLQLYREPRALHKIGKGSVYVPECFSSNSNRIKDCRLSRAQKPISVKNPINRANIYYCVVKKSSMTVSMT